MPPFIKEVFYRLIIQAKILYLSLLINSINLTRMESLIIPLFLLFISAVIFLLVYIAPTIRTTSSFILYYALYSHKYSKQKKIISRHITYFNKLSSFDKTVFLNRVNNFISDFEFEGRSGFQVTNEVKTLIGACAAQITFGQRNFRIGKIRKIMIYPEAYEYNNSGTFHKGTFAPGGIMVISWEDFKQGFHDSTDNLNLGLHEFAHAYHINILHTDEHDLFLDDFLRKFENIARKETDNINSNHFLREYAGENIYELFAVSVEHFFEQPKTFKSALPDLYETLCLLLNQDPANNSFRKLTKESIRKEEIKRIPKNYKTTSQSFTIQTIYAGIILMLYLTTNASIISAKNTFMHDNIILLNVIFLSVLFCSKFNKLYYYEDKILINKPFWPFSKIQKIDKSDVLYLKEELFVSLFYLRHKKSIWGSLDVSQIILGLLSEEKYDKISDLYE